MSIPVFVQADIPILEGMTTYSGWFLTFQTEPDEASDDHVTVHVGDKGAFEVEPEDGRLIGFEVYGVQRPQMENLNQPCPVCSTSGALRLPIGESFRHIGFRVGATRKGDMFRVQFFRAGTPTQYVRIAQGVVAGLNGENLAELWFEGVQATAKAA